MLFDGTVVFSDTIKYSYRCSRCGSLECSEDIPIICEESTQVILSQKEQWISETAVKLLLSIPYEYVCSGIGGQTIEARHLYAARIAKEMADVIFGEK